MIEMPVIRAALAQDPNASPENLFNIGGGVDYWMKPGVGLRLECEPAQQGHVINLFRGDFHDSSACLR